MTTQNLKPSRTEPECLSEDNKLELLRRIAVYESNEEILDWSKKKNLRIGRTTIEHYRNSQKWGAFIRKVRHEYANSLLEVPIANKRKRLERLEDMYQIFYTSGHYKEAVVTLGAAREELETKRGDVTNYVFNQYNQYNNLTDEEIEQKMIILADQLKTIRRNGKAVLELTGDSVQVKQP